MVHGLAKRADEMNWFRGMPAEVCRAIRASKAAGRVSELGERTPVHKARKAGAQKKIGVMPSRRGLF